METEGVHILHARNHISEVRIGPYLVDGYDPNTQTMNEFNGCYFHGCSDCKKDQDDLGKESKMHTETKEKYIRAKGYHMRIIWEHEFKSQERSDLKLKQFIQQQQPPFYRKHFLMAKESTILNAVLNDNFFGLLEVDIHVPDHLHSATLKSSSKTWAPSCKNMSEIMGCLINHVVSSSVAWELMKSCYLPLTWNG